MKQDRSTSLNPLSSIRIYSNVSASTSIKIIIYQLGLNPEPLSSSRLAKWLSDRLRTNWFWVEVQLQ